MTKTFENYHLKVINLVGKSTSDWIIMGGGLHGTYMAYKLQENNSIDIAVIDPHPRLLMQWERNTTNCGQEYLRSPDQHNLGKDRCSRNSSYGF